MVTPNNAIFALFGHKFENIRLEILKMFKHGNGLPHLKYCLIRPNQKSHVASLGVITAPDSERGSDLPAGMVSSMSTEIVEN